MKSVTVTEAKRYLVRVLTEVEKGEGIVLTSRGKAVGKLVAMPVAQGEMRFPDFAQLRQSLGTSEILGPNEVLAQRGKID